MHLVAAFITFPLICSDWKYLRMADEAEQMASANPDEDSLNRDSRAELVDDSDRAMNNTAPPRGRPSELYQAPIQEYSEEFSEDIEAMKAMGLPLSFTNHQAIDLDEVGGSFIPRILH